MVKEKLLRSSVRTVPPFHAAGLSLRSCRLRPDLTRSVRSIHLAPIIQTRNAGFLSEAPRRAVLTASQIVIVQVDARLKSVVAARRTSRSERRWRCRRLSRVIRRRAAGVAHGDQRPCGFKPVAFAIRASTRGRSHHDHETRIRNPASPNG